MSWCATSKPRKARKQHECDACGSTIERGDPYLYQSGVNDGVPWSSKTCDGCIHEPTWDYDNFVEHMAAKPRIAP